MWWERFSRGSLLGKGFARLLNLGVDIKHVRSARIGSCICSVIFSSQTSETRQRLRWCKRTLDVSLMGLPPTMLALWNSGFIRLLNLRNRKSVCCYDVPTTTVDGAATPRHTCLSGQISIVRSVLAIRSALAAGTRDSATIHHARAVKSSSCRWARLVRSPITLCLPHVALSLYIKEAGHHSSTSARYQRCSPHS